MEPNPTAMDLFPAESFVRLRNRERNMYVCADKDGIGVSLRSLGAARSMNSVWKVEILPVDGGGSHLLLQGAAYGRYLTSAHEGLVVKRGYRGVPAFQLNCDLPDADPYFLWTPFRVEEDGQGQDYIRLHNNELVDREQRCLRANGKHQRWKRGVTVDLWNANDTTMMQWTVEAIPSTAEPIPLPPPPPPPRRLPFRGRTEQPGRMIWHFRLNDDGNPVNDDWPDFVFRGNSVFNLRTQVANREHDENITLGVRAGYCARVIPLVTDLHSDLRIPMQIVVYTTGSQAADALRYPQL